METKVLGGPLEGSLEYKINNDFTISRNNSKSRGDGKNIYFFRADAGFGAFTDDQMMDLFTAYLALREEYAATEKKKKV